MFQKGNKAAVGHGRPRGKGFRGVAKMIMEETQDGAEMVRYALEVFRSKKTMRHEKWEAMCWLADRSLGKPVAMLELEAAITTPDEQPKMDLSRLDATGRARLREVMLRAMARPVVVGATSTGVPLRVIEGDCNKTDDEDDES